MFPTRLFPELSSQLDGAAQRFLAAIGITGEPVPGSPALASSTTSTSRPGRCLHHGPGTPPALYDGNSLGNAARTLGATLDAVRAVLAENPAPARRFRPRVAGFPFLAPHLAHRDPERRTKRLYLQDRLSTRQIAARYHIQRAAVADLLSSHGIPVGWRPPVGVNPEWLRHEYVEQGRTFKELAMETSSSPTALSRWAKRWGIPVRPRGRARP